nr:hypothetical protein BaRGS_027687 [Batillaria attramentaria]
MAGSFSTAQKLSLAGMFIGSMLCFVGLGAPYWLVSHIQIEGLGVPDELVGGSVGVFMVCLQALGEEECLMIDMNDDILAPAVFAHNMDVFTTTVMNVHVASYGWAFYLYCSGVGLLGLTSIMACFSAPENPIGGMVLGHPGPAAVIVTQTGAHPYLPMQEPGALAQVPGVAVVNTQNGY